MSNGLFPSPETRGVSYYEQVGLDEPLSPGDQVRIHCQWNTDWLYGRATQWALIEQRLQQDYPQFQVIRWQNTDDFLIFECLIIEPPAEMAGVEQATAMGIIVAIGLAVSFGLLSWACVNYTAERLVKAKTDYGETFSGKAEALGWSGMGIAAAIAAVYLLYKITR